MQLRCKVCADVQPVNYADIDDEDPRTQGIRRSFRAEHVARCGEGSVSLQLHSVEATYVDPQIFNQYVAAARPPIDVRLEATGFFSREIVRDGVTHQARVCEDCWQDIPRYVDCPAGLISPESDGAAGTVPKLRPSTVETDSPERAAAVEHLWKAVCVPCYRQAFQRVYPDAALPALREDVIGDGAPVTPPAPVSADQLGRVTLSTFDREGVLA